jgi:WD40 repeat protein
MCMQLSPDGRVAFTGSLDTSIRVWYLTYRTFSSSRHATRDADRVCVYTYAGTCAPGWR